MVIEQGKSALILSVAETSTGWWQQQEQFMQTVAYFGGSARVPPAVITATPVVAVPASAGKKS
jgi:hypothetical protein